MKLKTQTVPTRLLLGLAVMPYVVIDHGVGRLAEKNLVDRGGRPWWLRDFHQAWGVSAFFTLGVWYPFAGRDP